MIHEIEKKFPDNKHSKYCECNNCAERQGYINGCADTLEWIGKIENAYICQVAILKAHIELKKFIKD